MKTLELRQIIREEISKVLNEAKYSEFMLEWIVPGKESNTLMSKNLKELINFIDEKNIKGYIVKGWDGKKWDVLVKTI
jgi:hypothetical protein